MFLRLGAGAWTPMATHQPRYAGSYHLIRRERGNAIDGGQPHHGAGRNTACITFRALHGADRGTVNALRIIERFSSEVMSSPQARTGRGITKT